MAELSEYFAAFQNTVRSAAAADGSYSGQSFVEEVASRLTSSEEVDTLIYHHYEGQKSSGKQMQLDGYDFGDEDGQIVLAVSDFRSGDQIEPLSAAEIRRSFERLEAFLAACYDGTLANTLEESSDAFQVASDVMRLKPSTLKVRLYLLSNAQVSARAKGFETFEIAGVTVERHIWDIERLHRVESSELGREEIDIDLTEWVPDGVPALRTVSAATGLQTYLAVLPGALLAGIYSTYGGRVLEANVRAFLSGRSGVNKGIRGTIQQEPEMFLAYNNGIAATASAVGAAVEGGQVRITSIRDLQIVNGGQTTASLFYVERNDKADLADISVQMKLIVVADDVAAELIPRISRYANTQNKVSEADFFSNHPFHVRMEDKSRRMLVPALAGAHFQTKWFYERTRGQYLNERARLQTAQARKFDNEYPKSQMITKTDAAKYIVSWDQKPQLVSSGAQKNFIAFAENVSAEWKRDDAQFGDAYFQRLVGLGILYNSIRTMVMKSDWYSTGYLANIVTYTIAKLSAMAAQGGVGATFDFAAIWKTQSVPSDLLAELEVIAKRALEFLTDVDRPIVNVTEWAKRAECWGKFKADPIPVTPSLRTYFIASQEARSERTESRKVQLLDKGIDAQVEVMKLGSKYWVNLRGFAGGMRVLTEKDLGLLKYATGESGRLPSDLQSKALMQLSVRMREIGFVGN